MSNVQKTFTPKQKTFTQKQKAFPCDKKFTGALIGRKGATIKAMCKSASRNPSKPDVFAKYSNSQEAWIIKARDTAGCDRLIYQIQKRISALKTSTKEPEKTHVFKAPTNIYEVLHSGKTGKNTHKTSKKTSFSPPSNNSAQEA